MPVSPAFQIRLFGTLEVEHGGRSLPLPPSATARSLLAYLFLHHNRPLPRDRLAGTFWPGRPDAAARRALSQALWQIRRTLGPAADRLEAGQETVVLSLKEDDWIDVEAFRDLCTPRPSTSSLEEAHRLQEAIGLYRGDLLEAIYDDWALLERERLREIYLGALERLIILYKQWKEYGRALTYAQQLAAADPLREKAHRELMRLYHLVGRSQAALEQYSRLCELLDRELGIEPTSVTTALAREIANQANLAPSHLPMARAAPPVPLLEERVPIPLVGRREERALLLSYLDAAIGGHGGIVLVEGEAGVGKTRLLQEIAQDALWRGVQVLWGESVEGTPAYPYHPLVKALLVALSPLRVEQLAALVEEVWLCEVSRLIPQLSTWLPDLPPPTPLEPDQEQARFLEALARILRGLSQIAPYLLILEDLHWADEDTLTALAYLAPRLEQTRLLIIASHRQGQIREEPGRWQAFQALDRATGGRRLLLRRLNQEETTELVQRSLGLSTPAPIFGERIHRESEGNPLFILETLRTLYSEGLLYQDESGTWHTPWDETTTDYAEIPLPPTVEQVIWQRLTRLDDDAWTVLRGAAVLGQEATFRLLQSTTRLPQGRLLSALDELRRRYVLVETPAGYRFSHEKIRQVIYTGMDEESQRGLHQRAAYALEAAVPHQVVALAFHFEQGGVWAEALRYHRQAAEQATAAQAYAVAARHYERALALADRVDLPNEERFDLLGACETTMSVLGRRRDQMVCLERMARLAHNDPRRLAEVYHRRARMLVQTSRYSEAEEAAREAIRLAQEADDPLAEARARIAFGTALGIQGKRSPAIDHLQAAADIGRLLGDRRIEADAHALLSSLFLTANEHGPARLHAEAALGLYEAINYKRGVAGILGTLGRIDAMEGDLSQAEAYYQRSLKICRAIGYRQGEARNLLNWGLILVEQGRIGQALRLYQEALEAYRSVDDRRGEVLTLGNLADLCHHLLGDDDRAAQYAQAALRSCEAIRNPDRGYILLVLGCIACRRGEYEKARALLEEGLAAMRAVGKRRGEVDVHRALARLALIQGDPQAALEHLDQAETICRQTGLALPVAGLLAEKGVALLAQGQREAALAATKRAMARLQQGAEQGYLIPFAHYQVLTSLGQLEEARDAIEQAHRMLTEVLQSLSPEQREMSLERVPEHRAIVKAWQALQPRRLTFRLPRADAPTGRPLHDDEWVEVVWTVSVPDDDTIRGKVARRRHRLLRLLREAADQGAAPTVDHLAEALQVSPRTVKRDLAALRAAGHPTPTRGAREV